MCPKCFLKTAEKSNNYGFYLPNFHLVTISHINYWDQVNSWKTLWKFWNGPLFRNKLALFPLLNVAAYWQSSNTEACAKKLSQILVNNIDNGGRGIGLRIYVRYCSQIFCLKILVPYFFYSNLYLHLLKPSCENIFQIVCIISD